MKRFDFDGFEIWAIILLACIALFTLSSFLWLAYLLWEVKGTNAILERLVP